MNYTTHSLAAPGIILMCLGMVAIMFVPVLLRARSEAAAGAGVEKRNIFTIRLIAQAVLLMFLTTCTVLSLGRIYQTPIWCFIAALIVLALVSLVGKKSSVRNPTPPETGI